MNNNIQTFHGEDKKERRHRISLIEIMTNLKLVGGSNINKDISVGNQKTTLSLFLPFTTKPHFIHNKI